jgi:hypothetical protein
MSLDTRDLIETRDTLTNDILQAWNEYQEENLGGEWADCDNFDDVMQIAENLKDNGSLDFLTAWEGEIREVREINDLESEISSDEWDDGIYLIEEDDFEEYCEDFVKDCYNLSEIPQFIQNNIDWSGIASDMKYDYSEVDYQGNTYLFRS